VIHSAVKRTGVATSEWQETNSSCRFSKKEHLAARNFDRDQSAAHPQFAFLIGRVFRLRGYR